MIIGNIKFSRRALIRIGVAYVVLIVMTLLAVYLYQPSQNVSIFGSFWTSGNAIAHGQNPYIVPPETPISRKYHVAETNLNPPVLLPLFRIFALFDPLKADDAWLFISAVLFVLPALALLRQIGERVQSRQIAWLFLAPYLRDTLALGQIYTPLFALSVYAWIALKKDRPILAGILIGVLAAVKPPFILWPAYLLLARHFRVALVAIAVTVLLSVLPVILYGPGIYAEWYGAIALDQHARIFPHEISLNGFFLRAGIRPVGMALSGMLLLASSISVWIKRPNVFDTTAVALPVALLCSPLSWTAYVMVVIPVFLASRWDMKMSWIAILLLIPTVAASPAIGGPVWEVTLYGMIFLLPILMLAAEYILKLYQPLPTAQQPPATILADSAAY